MHNLEALHDAILRTVNDNRNRWDAETLTRNWQHAKPTRRVDAGKQSIEDSPLFGGPRQSDLFTQEEQ